MFLTRLTKNRISLSLLFPYSTKAKDMVKNAVSMLFASLSTKDQDVLLGDPTVSKVQRYKQITKFPWNTARDKVWLVQNVHNSGSCSVVFMKHVQSCYSCTIVSPCLSKKKTQTTLKYDIFGVHSVPVFRSSATIRISVSQQYSKLRYMHKEGRFHDASVSWNLHRFALCGISQVMFHPSAHTVRQRKTVVLYLVCHAAH